MQITFKSDFSFTLTPRSAASGETVELGDNWVLSLWTTTRSAQYVVSRNEEHFRNCAQSGTGIVVTVQNHHMLPGKLHGELAVLTRDESFPTGLRKTVVEVDHDVVLTDVQVSDPPVFDVEVSLPVLYASTYVMAVREGYTGTADEFYAMLKELPTRLTAIDELQTALGDIVTASGIIDDAARTISVDALRSQIDRLEQIVARLESLGQ